ncbi:U1 small nuclear ribonucleoprotein C, putative [Pediculus humanus corporis]|uniref:U1 small nuclear ribonucleoprotein C n=1 Tax=Pediculus humanus subsp. corporis TaxID=121224 RepID=RU1C_PEDHC|nr:U1 small nuclear ribonucleoprotein C, putative [Pediculus humanus corporis]E0VI98.1 RecName: Full=U1 small nuclear ribonucleoprotein C; Short=U1 snRNP C; Short=U1-C; Short=U1C [Pediculus humanus corporis]EEB13104.1 U1 small nuclear ribonucleoprotein C, putative [Pediculus humanus corporis]
MPKYYCDYCDTYLTHDSPSVRKTHCQGRKHKDNVKFYYQKWMEEQAQHLIDATTAAFKAGKIANPFAPKPGAAIPPPANMQGPPRPVPPGPMGPGPNMLGPGPMGPMGPMMMGPNGPIRGPMAGPIMGPMGPMMGPMGHMGPMMGPIGGPMMSPMRPIMTNMPQPGQPPRAKE